MGGWAARSADRPLARTEKLRESVRHGLHEQDVVTERRNDRDLSIDPTLLQRVCISHGVLRVPGVVILAHDEPHDHVAADMSCELKRLAGGSPSVPKRCICGCTASMSRIEVTGKHGQTSSR